MPCTTLGSRTGLAPEDQTGWKCHQPQLWFKKTATHRGLATAYMQLATTAPNCNYTAYKILDPGFWMHCFKTTQHPTLPSPVLWPQTLATPANHADRLGLRQAANAPPTGFRFDFSLKPRDGARQRPKLERYVTPARLQQLKALAAPHRCPSVSPQSGATACLTLAARRCVGQRPTATGPHRPGSATVTKGQLHSSPTHIKQLSPCRRLAVTNPSQKKGSVRACIDSKTSN